MGNFHCVPSGCAEVVYQEYLAPKIRYRYPGEEWQEKIADDYSLENVYQTCPGISYRLFYSRANISGGTLTGWTNFSSLLPTTVQGQGPYTNIRLSPSGMATQYYYGTPIFHWSFQQNGITPNGTRTRLYQIILDTPTLQNQIVLSSIAVRKNIRTFI